MDMVPPSAAVRPPETRAVPPSRGNGTGAWLPETRHVRKDRHARVLALLREHQEDQREAERDKAQKLLALRDEYRRAYSRLVSGDARRLLRQIGSRLHGREPGRRIGEIGPELRAHQRQANWRKRLAFRDLAGELRLDTAGIGRIQADFRTRFDRIAQPDFRGEAPPMELLHHEGGGDHAALPIVMGLHSPPYDGWDWRTDGWTSGAMWLQTSHDGLGPTESGPLIDADAGRVGSRAEMGDGDSSDCDVGFATCRSGVLVWFTPALTGPILVSASLRCIKTGWQITATDEWGISDASIWATGAVTLGVYADAGYEVSEADIFRWHYWGTPASGAPDYFNTDVPTPDPVDYHGGQQFQPGEMFHPGIMSPPGVYPAGEPVLLHVGVRHSASMVLNDVSASVASAGDWIIESISIGQDPNV